jgi:hypothetical protein
VVLLDAGTTNERLAFELPAEPPLPDKPGERASRRGSAPVLGRRD